MILDILGTAYTVEVKKYDEDPAFKDLCCIGYCDGYAKCIVVCDLSSVEGWKKNPPETRDKAQKATLRHEIVHAYFDESGLMDSALDYEGAWAKNEELVDWIALQGEKICRTWKEAECL